MVLAVLEPIAMVVDILFCLWWVYTAFLFFLGGGHLGSFVLSIYKSPKVQFTDFSQDYNSFYLGDMPPL